MPVTVIPPLDKTSPTFRADVDLLFATRIPQLTADLAAMEPQLNSVAANAALSSDAASAAAAAAGAMPWASGSYGKNSVVISGVNSHTYRKTTATSVTTVDPANDEANWVDLTPGNALKFNDAGVANTINYQKGTRQKWSPAAGAQALSVINWPASPVWGEILIKIVDGGSRTLTSSVAINWLKPDGTTVSSTSINTNHGTTLRTTGVDRMLLWREEDGTIYGKFVR